MFAFSMQPRCSRDKDPIATLVRSGTCQPPAGMLHLQLPLRMLQSCLLPFLQCTKYRLWANGASGNSCSACLFVSLTLLSVHLTPGGARLSPWRRAALRRGRLTAGLQLLV